MRQFIQNTQAHRPRGNEPLRAVVIQPVLPNGTGTADIVFVDPSGEVGRPSSESPDRSFTVTDANDNNCLLPEELIWVRFEQEVGSFIPIGSQGLTRRAFANQAIEAGSSGEFTLAKDGEVVTYTNDDDEVVDAVVTVTTANAVEKDELCWIVYLIGEESSGGEAFRPGRWEVLTVDSEDDCGCKDYVCCDCEKSTLYVELSNANITWEVVKKVVTGGNITHTIELTCGDDGATRLIELTALDCSTVDCQTLDMTGEYVGACEIGVIEYGNSLECAPDGGGDDEPVGDPDPDNVCPLNSPPHSYLETYSTQPDGNHLATPVGISNALLSTAPTITPKFKGSRFYARVRFKVEASAGGMGGAIQLNVPNEPGQPTALLKFSLVMWDINEPGHVHLNSWLNGSFWMDGSASFGPQRFADFDNNYHEFEITEIQNNYRASFDGITFKGVKPTTSVCNGVYSDPGSVSSDLSFTTTLHNYTTDSADILVDTLEVRWI